MRIGKKSVYQGNTSETSYVVSGTQILSETKGSSTNYYIYDDKGLPIGIVYNGTTYTYRKNIQGDIIAILDSSGAEVVTYTYNAWGVATVGGSLASTLGAKNPFRYRGYYYDTETGYYYLNSRYYDPVTGRFLNADTTSVLTATPTALTDKNLYAYCDNNPVMRVDDGGEFWDTIFDAVSLVTSIIDVVKNPSDPLAWASLAADAVSLAVPGLMAGGAIVKAISKADDALDAAKSVYKAADKASDIRKATGSYEIVYKSGHTYVGKGGFKRALKSAERNAVNYNDSVKSISWIKAADEKSAFIQEYKSMCKFGGPNNSTIKNANSYNKIWSPGRKYYHEMYGSYYSYGGKVW